MLSILSFNDPRVKTKTVLEMACKMDKKSKGFKKKKMGGSYCLSLLTTDYIGVELGNHFTVSPDSCNPSPLRWGW